VLGIPRGEFITA